MLEQLRFENEAYLYGIALAPVLILLFLWMQYRQGKALRQWGHMPTLQQFLTDYPVYKRWVKVSLLAVAVALLSLGLANLQYGSKEKQVTQKGVDIIIALDLSKSMLAEDIEPSRLKKARFFIRQLLTELTNDRVGLVVFAGNAYMQMPLTVDYAAANLFLNSVGTDMIPTQGTAIGDALELGQQAFENNQEQYKTMLVISDGENHAGGAVQAAKKAQEKDIVVHTIGIGTADGAPIPIKKGGKQIDFVRNDGEVVVSQLNEDILKTIAEKGGGQFLSLQNTAQTVEAFSKALNQMEKRKIDTKVYTDYTDHFQYFLGAALFLFVIEFLITERKSRFLEKLKL